MKMTALTTFKLPLEYMGHGLFRDADGKLVEADDIAAFLNSRKRSLPVSASTIITSPIRGTQRRAKRN